MTDNRELIAKARAVDVHDEHNVWENASLFRELADALEAAERALASERAKLAKAVELLDKLDLGFGEPLSGANIVISQTLAEIRGRKSWVRSR